MTDSTSNSNTRSPVTLRTHIALLRPFTLLAPVVGVLAGVTTAYGAMGGAVSWPMASVVYACLSAALATGASNVWNQVFDAPIDSVNKPTRMIPAGRIDAARATSFGAWLAAGTLVFGWLAGPAFAVFVSLGLLLTWMYSAPPLRLKAHPIGANGAIAIARGLLVPVAGWSLLAPAWASDPWVLGACACVFLLGAASTKDFTDVDGDRAYGCRTWPILYGTRGAARRMTPFVVGAFGLLPAAAYLGGLSIPVPHAAVLAVVLMLLGVRASWLLLHDPNAVSNRSGNHPAWRWMYITLLVFFVGAAAVYNL